MRGSRIFGVLVVASAAIVAASAPVMAQSTADKMEQKAKGAAHDAKIGMTDSWVTSKVKIALFADDRVKGRQVSVETVNGAVSLRGKVDSDEAKAAAGSVAQGVEHVKSVRNDLQVVSSGDRKVIDTSDKDITRQVEGRMSKDAQFKKIEVRTDGGSVILTGSVASIGASARASEIAREVPGVRMVKNELTYDEGMRTRDGAGMRTAGSTEWVVAAQQALKDKGFDPGPIDGRMGPRTTAALRAYQASENLGTTGAMDRDTSVKLGVKIGTQGR